MRIVRAQVAAAASAAEEEVDVVVIAGAARAAGTPAVDATKLYQSQLL